ncbi:MAG: TIM barrel protein [Candidatus Staskawiczbacteria bacterium]|nr:TIM barrel protein [Candidatus Staskawiczbacteria bacterium]
MFNRGPVTQRSMPFWPLQYRGTDPFGGPILGAMDSLETADLLCWAGKEGFIELTSAHDDDLVPWNPKRPEDDLDKSGLVYGRLMEIRQKLDAANVGFHMVTCCLHGDPMFRRGGLTNPDPKIRELAKLKVQRTLRIGSMLGAKRFTYWVARDGFEVMITVDPKVMDWLAEGLNSAISYMTEASLDYDMATIEPKPNEPRGHMYLPTAGHAAAFTQALNEPGFWKVNPELTQHEGMAGLDPITCIRLLVKLDKLGFLHFGNQINGQFDNDFPPLVGPEHLKETAEMFRVLEQLGWKGVVEYDCHALRSELNPDDSLGCKKDFIVDCTMGLSISLKLAERIKSLVFGMRESQADLNSIMLLCNLSDEDVSHYLVR